MNRKELQKLARFAINKLARIDYIGEENIPKQGGFILATNHMSRVDIPILFIMPVRDDVIALAADKYKKNPLFRYLIETSENIWIDRDKADFAALRAAVLCLKSGQVLGIAPEGTRSSTGQLNEGKPGTALIAERAQVAILPAGLAGTETAFKKLLAFQRPHITVRFGKPFELPPMTRENREAWLRDTTEEIMCRLAAVLPPQYHGFYANHPRLKELLPD
jgi:1-acyl-sn-glycerol-3-phosphate acyltransferase